MNTVTLNTSGLTVGGTVPTYTTVSSGSAYTYSSPYTISGLNGTSTWSTNTVDNANGITVKGDAEFEGDITVNGKSLNKWMETMEKRLAILVPDPKKLAQFEALQKAYNNYKMLEALCEVQEDEPK